VAIVEKESNMRDERPTIAGVYMNRLNKGMKLQADPTVKYAVGDFTIKRIAGAMLSNPSPYNTYQHTGLPPGPIGNPGRQALLAAVNPEPGDWIYFITVAPNDTRFTSSFEEFGIWKVEYKKNLRAGLFESKE
jgi:UPF0755 protein